MSSKKLVFYDLKSKEESCWSPNLWKTRLALNYKKIPYDVVWLGYVDIKPTIGKHCQQDSEAPMLPVIEHNGTWVHDSWEILLYLEKTFPDAPTLLNPTIEQTYFFTQYMGAIVFPSCAKVLLPITAEMLDEPNSAYFHRTRAKRFGAPLPVWGKGAKIESMKDPLTPVQLTLKNYGPYIGGKQLSYQDVVLLALFLWFQVADKSILDEVLGFYGDDVLKNWYERMLPLAEL